MKAQHKLIPLAMVICDTVIQDSISKKKSLVGLFSRINAKKAPVQHPRFNVLLVLTEGRGKYDCELKCIHADTHREVVKAKGSIQFRSPNQVVELIFDLSGLTFPQFGHYRLEFLANGSPVISRKVNVLEIKK